MKFLMFGVLLFSSAMAFSETPFTIDKFHASQAAGEKILLHFHADWCPTCKAQQKILAQLGPSGILSKITVYPVDYNKETEFKKEMKVTAQSTFITFFGKLEVERSSGVTDIEKVKNLINKLSKMTLSDQRSLMEKKTSH